MNKLAQLLDRNVLMSGTGLLLAIGLFVSLNIIINLTITSVRLDLTESKLFTLSEGTRNILASLEEPIKLRLYASRGQLSEYPLLANYAVRIHDMLREYQAHANGNLEVVVIDPAPFSEEEDEAVAAGLRNIPVGNSGDQAYLGLEGVNSTDDRQVIPFLTPNKEASLEYEVTKLIYNLINPSKRTVGIISSLPLFGSAAPPPNNEPWSIVQVIREFFEVRDLSETPTAIANIDVLMLIHPKDLDDQVLYAIDQYVLGGGKLMVFVDPLSDHDLNNPPETETATLPDVDSELDLLLSNWGVEVTAEKVVGDLDAAMRVQHRGARGLQEIDYLPWLRMQQDNFNAEDFSVSEIKLLHIGAAGALSKREGEEGATVEFIPLVQTTEQSTLLERDLVLFQRDPNVILQAFKPEGKRLTVVARLSGTARTAFPDGKPESEEEAGGSPDHKEEGEINAIIAADSDLLQDRFWIRLQRIFDLRIPQTIANNGDFIVNTLENLSGNTDLISLRSRGDYQRPFTRVEALRREAEARFRDEEQQLREKLEETEERIRGLQQQQEGGGEILTPAQAREIEKFKKERLKTRKQLRAVQHDLQKNIDALGSRLRFINIILVPLVVVLAAILLYWLRSRRFARRTI